MGQNNNNSRGFALIAALLILVLLSGVAAGLFFMVGNERHMSGNNLEDNLATYGAESGMEKLTSDLSALYTANMTPTNVQIQNLTNSPPTSAMVGAMNYTETISYAQDANGNPVSSWNTISSGSNQGLYAEIVPMTLQVIASRPPSASVNMTRKVEIAQIPVFQFGVFCGYDCSYFPGPNFSFGGRVHTNGNLFLASGSSLVFNDKLSAFKQIITDELENGHPTSAGYGGTQYVPKASAGCPLNTFPPSGSNCVALPGAPTVPGDASWSGGIPGVSGSTNPNFPSISSGTLNGFMVNSLTGATNLQLPFVKNSCTSNPPPCTDPIAIIRKPLAGESPTSTLGTSRLYNKAQIRILLADTQLDLHPERGLIGDGQDVQFVPNGFVNVGGANEFFGMAQNGVNNWIDPINPATGASYNWTTWPLLGEITTNPPNVAGPGGVGAWIRVEYLNNAGTWVGITNEWLGYGFGRAFNTVPTGPAGSAGQNAINPNAILILQQLRQAGLAATGAGTANNWYPINLYDTREGEMRDTVALGCAVNGIINTVELDVGNLALWLAGNAPYGAGTGRNVNLTNQNGYVLYFSDHRGMLPDPNPSNGGQTPAGVINGESGLEDVINWSQPSTSSTPDGVLENTATKYYTYSPEDVDQNGLLDNWGGRNIGNGFGVNTNTAPPNPYLTATCNTTGQANAVTGARHALKLVDGGMNAGGTSYLPVRWDNNQGGFTVASENPVYVNGNYNSSSADPFWTNNANNTTPHAAAAIIADAVTVLSNQWTDLNSLNNPTSLGNRSAGSAGQDTYYRMAVAGGKNIPFPQPTWSGSSQDFGTDGGLHNFLRYLENWGNVNLWYNGSLVSMYYAEYNTGTFKCCTTVYSPPARKYYFDTLFLNPANLPPGTPMFQDVVNLSYHQNFTPQ
jgi:Tfp pilus assembly protein PilX